LRASSACNSGRITSVMVTIAPHTVGNPCQRCYHK
jgi:hypothetical protein